MRLLVAPPLLVGMMGCTGADDQAIIGIWTYDSFTRDGETIAVVVQFDDMAPETFSIYTCP